MGETTEARPGYQRRGPRFGSEEAETVNLFPYNDLVEAQFDKTQQNGARSAALRSVLLHYGERENERESRSLDAGVNLQRAPHGLYKSAHDREPETGAREPKLHALGGEPVA